ncbi:MAG: hypothetical protein ABWX67_01870 [Allosphingosinicella sp.]
MKLLSVLVAAAFATAAPAAPPEPGPGVDALAETLLSVLPDRAQIEAVQPPDPEQLAALIRINPGKAPQVTAILKDAQTCLAPAAAEGVRTMVRKAARYIGAAKTQRMIEFYRLDPAVMLGLIGRLRGPAPSPADKAEEARLHAAYPLQEYAQAFDRAMAEAGEDSAFMAEAVRCADARDLALARAGLKVEQP